MIPLSRDEIDSAVSGTLFREPGETVSPVRLPPSVVLRGADASMQRFARQAAGVRLRWRTTATELRLLLEVVVSSDGMRSPEEYPAFITPVIDGQRQAPVLARTTGIVRYEPDGVITEQMGDPDELKIELGSTTTERLIELWLPHRAIVHIHEVHTDAPVRPADDDSSVVRWAHYGSSISQCFEVSDPLDSWPSAVAHRLGWDVVHMGFAGQALIDGFVARAIARSGPDVISLELGVNVVNGDAMRPRVFVSATHAFLDTLVEQLPRTPIVVVSPIQCPLHENHPGPVVRLPDGELIPSVPSDAAPHLTASLARTLLERVVHERNDPRIEYVDGRTLLGPGDEGMLVDRLHPGPEGYAQIGHRFAGRIQEALGVHREGAQL